MKKIFVSFLCVLTFWHFGLSAFASDFEPENDNINYDLELPIVYDTPSSYSLGATLGLGSLGSGALSGVLGGTGVVVGGLLGAGALALGGYVVGKGLYNVYNQVKNWALTQSQAEAVELDLELDSDGNLKVDATSISDDLVQNLGSTMSYETNNGLFSALNSQYALTKKNQSYIYMPNGVIYTHSGGTNNTSVIGGDCGASYSCYQVTNGAYQYYYKGDNYYLTHFKFGTYLDRYGSPNKDKMFYGAGYVYDKSLGAYLPFTTYMQFNTKSSEFFSYSTTIDDILYYNGLKFFTEFGLNFVSTAQLESLILQSFNSSNALTIPKDYIGVSNPGLTWNGQSWVNSDGETVPPKDMMLPFPDMFNPTTGQWEFSDSISESLGGSTTAPPPDTSIPDTGTGWLSSILNAIMSLPDLIASAFSSLFDTIVNAIKAIPNAFMNVLGAISTAISNTWEWCQNLPNVLGELLNALGSAITGAFTGILNGILTAINTIVDFFANILSFVMSLVIPQSGFFVSELSELGDIFISKFPFFGQIGDIMKAFKFDLNAKLPEFKITVPKNIYGGGTYHVITFDAFVQYRVVILNFIRLFTWFPFILRMYKKSIYMATGH